jgi:hypothetical protein
MVGPPVYAVATNTRNSFGNNNIVATVGSTGIAAGDTATVSVATGTFAGANWLHRQQGQHLHRRRRPQLRPRPSVRLQFAPDDRAHGRGYDHRDLPAIQRHQCGQRQTPSPAGQATANVLAGNSGQRQQRQSKLRQHHNRRPNRADRRRRSRQYANLHAGANYTLVGQVSGGSGAAKRTVSPEFRIVSSGGTYSAGGTISNGGQFWQAAVVGYAGQ